MKTRRTAKVSEAIRQVVSSAILHEMRDPRVQNVTVLHVETANDLRSAKVFISVLGDEKTSQLSLKGLVAARGWLQSKIADQLQLRLTPILTFVLDPGVKKSIEVSQMLHELGLSSEENPPHDIDPAAEDEEVDLRNDLSESSESEPDLTSPEG